MRVLLAPGPCAPQPGGVPLVDAACTLGAGQVAQALAQGWLSRRPSDTVRVLPLGDGAAGSGDALMPLAQQQYSLPVSGPCGEEAEMLLLRLPPVGVSEHGASYTAGESTADRGGTWFLDAGTTLFMPSERAEAARHAQEGSTRGLGEALLACMEHMHPRDLLIVGLGRCAVHDGGAGMLEALGGSEAAVNLLARRHVWLALADDVALGGLRGAGQGLISVAGLSIHDSAERDRQVCAYATAMAEHIAAVRQTSAASEQGSVPMRQVAMAVPAARGSETKRHRDGGYWEQNSTSRHTPRLSVTLWGTGAGGGAALVLRALGARALPGARVMLDLLGVHEAVQDADVVVSAVGEMYDVLTDSITGVLGEAVRERALPMVQVTGRALLPRGEAAAAGISRVVSLEEMGSGLGVPWDCLSREELRECMTQMGARLARTWSR